MADPAFDVIVIGGGVAGLTAAVALGEQGQRVLLLERQDRLGGRAQSWRDETTGDLVDIGPHVVHTRYRNFLHLLARLGTADAIAWQQDPLLTIVDAGRTLRLPGARWIEPFHMVPAMLRTPLPAKDQLSNVRVTWRVMAMNEPDFRRWDAVSAADYLSAAGVSPRFMEWFWASVAIAILNRPLRECSAGALLRFYQQLIGHKDARFGVPRVALDELVAAPAGRQVASRGGSIRTQVAARRLVVREDRIEELELADGARLQARNYVLAVAPDAVPALAPPSAWIANGAPEVHAPPPCPYLCVYLWLDRPIASAAFWTRTWSEQKFSYDCYDLAKIRSGWAGRPSVIAANVIDSRRVGHLDDAEVVRRTLDDVAEHAPAVRSARLVHARVHRIPLAIPGPVPGSERARPLVQTRFRNLFLASDWCDTSLPASMESAARAGWLAAEGVMASCGRPVRLAHPPDAPRGLVGLLARWAARRFR